MEPRKHANFHAMAANPLQSISAGGFIFGAARAVMVALWDMAPMPGKAVENFNLFEVAKSSVKTSVYLGLITTTFAGSTYLMSSLRSTDDSWNYGFGGAVMGALSGMRSNRLHSVVVQTVVVGAGTAMLTSGIRDAYRFKGRRTDQIPSIAK